jgi:ribosomal protein L29
MKADTKARCLSNYGVKLGRLLNEDVMSKAASLEELRARQLALRMQAAGETEGSKDRAEARRFRREIAALDKEKAALKKGAAKVYGVKLSRYAADMPKC